MRDWTPAEVIAVAAALTQLVLAFAALFVAFSTKAAVKDTAGQIGSVRKDVDGRLSQMMDLIARLAGATDRRAPENRSAAGDPPKAP